jgi:hypothetical protein
MKKKCKSRRVICTMHVKRKSPQHSRMRKRSIKKLIYIRRCVPIKQTSDNRSAQTYFYVSTNSVIKLPTGTITIINTSRSCKMEITILKSSNDHDAFEVGPNSSITAIVSNVKSVNILCKGESDNDCTGSIELDMHYILRF